MDPVLAALGVTPPRGNPPPGAGIVTPAQQQPDTFDGSPQDIAAANRAIANAPKTPAAQAAAADLQSVVAGKAAVDPVLAALGVGSPQAAPAAAPQAVQAPQAAPQPVAQRPTSGNRGTDELAGAGETAWALGSGMLSSAAGGLAGLAGSVLPGPAGQGAAWSRAVQDAGTYQPRTAEGQRNVEIAGKIQVPFQKAGEWAQEGTEATGAAGSGVMGAVARAGLENLPALIGVPGVRGTVAKSGAETAMEAAFRRARGESEPAVAPTASGKTIADATPELRQRFTEAQARGEKVNPEVAARHLTADTLPVPVRLTAGQATLDPGLISAEMNGRGKTGAPVPPEFYKAQGKALAQNVDAVQARVAPDIADTSRTTLGQTLVDAYKTKDAPIVADISAKYKALADANGGALPIDGKAFVANTDAALRKALKSGSVPADLASAMQEFRAGRQMTFEDFETLRSDAADAMRSASDGRARAAAGIIREQLENMPLTAEAAQLKPLADAARSAAKARFDALEKDPAYKAAISDPAAMGEPSPLADNFALGYVINGRHANVRQMHANLAADSGATQAMAAAQLEHLRALAKADAETGNFSQAGWNNGVKAAGPKLAEILGPENAQTLQAIGETAKLAQAQPRGSFVNNSNTATALMAEGAKNAATHGTNMLFGGIPVGSVVRNVGGRVLDSRQAARARQQATEPGAGMTRLSEIGK